MKYLNEGSRNYTFSYIDGSKETLYNCKSFIDAVKQAEEIGLPFDVEFKVSSEESALFLKSKEGKGKGKFTKDFAFKHGFEYIDLKLS